LSYAENHVVGILLMKFVRLIEIGSNQKYQVNKLVHQTV